MGLLIHVAAMFQAIRHPEEMRPSSNWCCELEGCAKQIMAGIATKRFGDGIALTGLVAGQIEHCQKLVDL